MIDVSVIIPTHNRSEMLVRALDSVVRQRQLPDEVIVVDDGSTDATRQKVAMVSASSPLNLRYHYQANRGPAAARNTGIKMAAGRWLAFLDSDDQWHRDKLVLQHQALAANAGYLVSHTRERWYRNGAHLNQKKYHFPGHGDIFDRALKLCCVGMSTAMVSRELFDRYGLFDECLRCCEDYEFWLRVAAVEKFYLLEQQLTVKHGGRPDQVSNRFRVGMDRFRIYALAKLITSKSLPLQRRPAACRELSRRCQIYARGCSKHGKADEAKFYQRLPNSICSISGADNQQVR